MDIFFGRGWVETCGNHQAVEVNPAVSFFFVSIVFLSGGVKPSARLQYTESGWFHHLVLLLPSDIFHVPPGV